MAQHVRAIKGRIGNIGSFALGMFARPSGRERDLVIAAENAADAVFSWGEE